MEFFLNKDKMYATFPVAAPIVEAASATIAIPFLFVGFVIGSVWDGLRLGFIVGRDV